MEKMFNGKFSAGLKKVFGDRANIIDPSVHPIASQTVPFENILLFRRK